ncbi:hypothetical protein DENSPDRAFT_896341, partial [Dentipellis sp. KUC8613]
LRASDAARRRHGGACKRQCEAQEDAVGRETTGRGMQTARTAVRGTKTARWGTRWPTGCEATPWEAKRVRQGANRDDGSVRGLRKCGTGWHRNAGAKRRRTSAKGWCTGTKRRRRVDMGGRRGRARMEARDVVSQIRERKTAAYGRETATRGRGTTADARRVVT